MVCDVNVGVDVDDGYTRSEMVKLEGLIIATCGDGVGVMIEGVRSAVWTRDMWKVRRGWWC